MQRALWIAASGMEAQQLNVDTIANNLANVNTTAFKRSRAEFQDLLYTTLISPGASSSASTRFPSGAQVGHGAKVSAIKKVFSQGDFQRTDNPLDLIIEGSGFFKVLLPDGTTTYTRDGAFSTNSDGIVVNAQGYTLDPPVNIPPDALRITVGADGTVSVDQPGQTTPSQVGTIELARFANPSGLSASGGNLFLPTSASGEPTLGSPGTDGFGAIGQGFIEMSNVSVVQELVTMIAAQRAYELNSRAVRASDEMLSNLNNLVR